MATADDMTTAGDKIIADDITTCAITTAGYTEDKRESSSGQYLEGSSVDPEPKTVEINVDDVTLDTTQTDVVKDNDVTRNMSTVDTNQKCGMCLGDFNDPKLLTCFHTFCAGCIEGYVLGIGEEKYSYSCPLCATEFTLPKDTGVDGLPNNLFASAGQASAKFLHACCDACNDGTQAENRCLNCMQNFCTSCSTYHQKIAVLREHRLVLLPDDSACVAEAASPEKGRRIMHKTYCGKHTTEELRFHCQICKLSVCRDCKATSHEGHKSSDISDEADLVRDQIGQLLQRTTSFIPKIRSCLVELEVYQHVLAAEADEALAKINARPAIIQEQIEQIRSSHVGLVTRKRDNELHRLSDCKQELESLFSSVSTLVDTANQIVQLGDDVSMIEISQRLRTRLEQINNDVPTKITEVAKSKIQFIPAVFTTKALEMKFGHNTCACADTLPSASSQCVDSSGIPEIETTLLASFTSHIGDVCAIAPTCDGDAWVCYSANKKEIHLIGSDGRKKKTVTLDMEFRDIITTPSGYVIMTNPDRKTLFSLCLDYEQQVLLKKLFSADEPLYIAMGAANVNSNTIPVHSCRTHYRIQLSPDDCTIDSMTAYTQKHSFKGIPMKFCENPREGHLCVISDSGEYGYYNRRLMTRPKSLTALSHYGQQKFEYGQLLSNGHSSFDPVDICCDVFGQTLVSDAGNCCVHVFDASGQHRQDIVTRKDGLTKPGAIAIDCQGRLWVGDSKAGVRVYQYIKDVNGTAQTPSHLYTHVPRKQTHVAFQLRRQHPSGYC